VELTGIEATFLRSAVWRELTRRTVLPWILSFGDLPSRAEVLEVGCGAGYNSETLLDRFPNWILTATDFDPNMVALAKVRLERFGARARVEVADAAKLPYEDQRFDLVLSLGVWHHVGSWEDALKEAARVLRPQGRLLLVDLLADFFRGPVARMFPPERTYTLAELRPQLARAGFSRFRVKAAGRLWYRLIAEMPG